MNPLRDVIEFHKKYGLSYDGPPRDLDPDLKEFRTDFITEEYSELLSAILVENNPLIGEDSRAHQLDAICDLIYVLIGYAHMRGWDIAEAWRRVHEANMTKVRAKPGQGRSDWDVVKTPSFVPPDLCDLV